MWQETIHKACYVPSPWMVSDSFHNHIMQSAESGQQLDETVIASLGLAFCSAVIPVSPSSLKIIPVVTWIPQMKTLTIFTLFSYIYDTHIHMIGTHRWSLNHMKIRCQHLIFLLNTTVSSSRSENIPLHGYCIVIKIQKLKLIWSVICRYC